MTINKDEDFSEKAYTSQHRSNMNLAFYNFNGSKDGQPAPNPPAQPERLMSPGGGDRCPSRNVRSRGAALRSAQGRRQENLRIGSPFPVMPKGPV